jgi:hypothetical protein
MITLLLYILLAIIVLGIHSYTFYLFTSKGLNLNPSHKLIRFTLGGAVVPHGNGVPNGDYAHDGATTVVELTDAELNQLLQIIFAEIGNSNLISVNLLQSLGLYTDTVVSLLESLGYIIF